MHITIASENAVIVQFAQRQSADILQQVCQLQDMLKQQLAAVIHDTTASYASLLITFDSGKVSHRQLAKQIRQLFHESQAEAVASAEPASTVMKNTVTLSVYYGEEVALDLAMVARHTGLTPEEVIQRH